MAEGRVWAIRGVSDRTREAVLETAHDAGLTIGAWLDRVLARAVEEARHPEPPAATREEVAEVVRAQLIPIAERLASLEERVSRGVGPEPTSAVAAAPPPVAAEESGEHPEAGLEPAPAPEQPPGRGRRLPEPVRLRIAELHRAGRSMSAISHELGVPYNTVYRHVKALGGRAPS